MKIKLSTPVVFSCQPERPLNHSDIFVGIGSCFAENMLAKLFNAGIDGMSNPNGIVYNCVSIAKSLKRIEFSDYYTEKDFFLFNGLWHSWEHHGSFSKSKIETAVFNVNSALEKFKNYLQSASCVVITPSSSVVYQLVEESLIVANCHKVPNNRFKQKLLSFSDTTAALNQIINSIKKINPEAIVLFTLSPVKHYPGDLELNSVSKAILRHCIDQCIDITEKIFYFPAYEIMIDELRDYRFYKDDMLHPSALAENIIFDKFIKNWFSAESREKIYSTLKQLKSQVHISNTQKSYRS